ncbi:hypothetical protein CKM354_001075900 [Cercospora kikuchii]|uniref:C2H2-type domain-containing protein n=1 Tax=Cercospora kikuchii TaxID=84275 RepID=A0A9P3CRM2_9PEZI|nr:uncharacterized protein CKM354_001075900 [Cercospora kikuchii]GIZ47674.1 hypothetical protein CKM354_001075900 [Cercospora kikuchii]
MAARSYLHETDDDPNEPEHSLVSSSSSLAYPIMSSIVDGFGGPYSLVPSTSNAISYASRVHNFEDHPDALGEPMVALGTPAYAIMLELSGFTEYYGSSHSLLQYASNHTDYAMRGDLEMALARDTHSNQPFTCDQSPHCRQTFSERKSLYRHLRTVHGFARFSCPFSCSELSFARQDILKRHIKSHHSEGAAKVACKVCDTSVRLRSLPAHWRSAKHKKAQAVATKARDATMRYLRQYSERSPTPDYPDAIADPVLLAAWAFMKLNPWGCNSHRWMAFETAPDPPMKLSEDYLKLRVEVYRQLRKAVGTEQAIRDRALPDALVIMTVLDAQTDGFEAGMVHCRALIRLGTLQLSEADDTETWINDESSAEAFETASLRGVHEISRHPCQRLFTMLLKLMRRAAVQTMFMPFHDSDVSVWDRLDFLTHDAWVGHYAQELQTIKSLAQSIELE